MAQVFTSELHEEEFKAYEELKRNEYKENSTLLPLDVTSHQMAKLLFCIYSVIIYLVNNYEINTIFEPFLRIWYLEPKNCFILLPRLIEIFPPDYKGILKMFFQESYVTYEDFFIMSCCFIFFNIKQILLLLLSMSQIFSNVFISRKQVNDFFASYYLDKEKYCNLLDILMKSAEECHCPENMYYMKDFLSYFQESQDFNLFMKSFKYFLIELTMKQCNYEIIKERMKFYYDHINHDNRKTLVVPKESCFNKTIRICFTSRPAPYHYDYCTLTNREKGFDDMLFLLRQVFGYSCRKSSFKEDYPNAKLSVKSDKSDKSITGSNHKIVGSFQRFRTRPSRSCGYPAIQLQSPSLNNLYPLSNSHKYSGSNKHFFSKNKLTKNKINPEEVIEKTEG